MTALKTCQHGERLPLLFSFSQSLLGLLEVYPGPVAMLFQQMKKVRSTQKSQWSPGIQRPTNWTLANVNGMLIIAQILFPRKKRPSAGHFSLVLGNVNNDKQVIKMMTIPTRYITKIIDLRY